MARTNQRGRKNNNPEGHNQYSNGWMDSAKDKPFTTAAAAAAAVGAGVFLWSRRNQISEQISNLSDQISDWSQSMRSGSEQGGEEFEFAGTDTGSFATASGAARGKGRSKASSPSRGNGRSSKGMSETGGGNASLGAHSGSSGIGSAS